MGISHKVEIFRLHPLIQSHLVPFPCLLPCRRAPRIPPCGPPSTPLFAIAVVVTRMPKSKAIIKFLPTHATTYGLKVSARHPSSGEVSSCVCRFCIAFGREEKIGGKRARTTNMKYFQTFRTDGYQRHLSTAHAQKWAEYQQLESKEDKEQFFKSQTSYVNSLDAHLEDKQQIHFLINAPIVETVIGELLFHPDDVEGVTRERALNMFKKLEDPSGANEVGQREVYELVLKTRRRFELCIKFVSCGASFRMASRLMDCTQAESGMAVYGGCSYLVTSSYTRIVCANALQILSDVLKEVWAFSVALDGSTHQGFSYLDIRVRFHWKGELLNFHLMALPLYERHTGDNMFEVLKRFLDAVFSNSWTKKCVAVSTDGARNMTGRVQGLVTRIQHCCLPGMLRIWCGLHQLDLVMQRVFKPSLEGQFYSTLTTLIGHLRRQANLISEMRSTCPKVSDVRWISMFSSTQWLVENRRRIQQHLDQKKPAWAPSKVWWIFLHGLNAFAAEAKAVFISLQGLTTTISQQRSRLTGLANIFCQMSGMEGPLSQRQIDDIMALQPAERCGDFVVSHEHVRLFLDGLSLWVLEALDSLEVDDVHVLASSIGKLFVEAADGISQIECERGASNEPADQLPAVLPHELAHLDMRQFAKVLQLHRDRLLPVFKAEGIESISQQFSQFLRALRQEPQFKDAVLGASDASKSFRECWAPTNYRFPLLQDFCGGLAAAFPNTATVESDFSIIGWEKDDCRMDLTDFSLEGILHSKQYSRLQKLSRDLSKED